MMVSNRNLLFQGSIFRFHVCFGWCIYFFTVQFKSREIPGTLEWWDSYSCRFSYATSCISFDHSFACLDFSEKRDSFSNLLSTKYAEKIENPSCETSCLSQHQHLPTRYGGILFWKKNTPPEMGPFIKRQKKHHTPEK